MSIFLSGLVSFDRFRPARPQTLYQTPIIFTRVGVSIFFSSKNTKKNKKNTKNKNTIFNENQVKKYTNIYKIKIPRRIFFHMVFFLNPHPVLRSSGVGTSSKISEQQPYSFVRSFEHYTVLFEQVPIPERIYIPENLKTIKIFK